MIKKSLGHFQIENCVPIPDVVSFNMFHGYSIVAINWIVVS